MLIGEEDVDARTDQLDEAGAEAIHKEGIGEREREPLARILHDADGRLQRLVGVQLVPEIALDVGDCGLREHLDVDVGHAEASGCAEERAHGALRIRRDVDQTATGRDRSRGGERGVEADPNRAEILGVDVAELVVTDLPDESCPCTEDRGDNRGVGRRTSGQLQEIVAVVQCPTRHIAVERHGTILIDQLHRALCQRMVRQEHVIRVSEDIDDRVTDRHDLMGGYGTHGRER